MNFVIEPEQTLPVAREVDVCVIGGSCTGVFAAVRAARLGQRVALVEKRSLLGGMATAAQVTQWHSTYDVAAQNKIIGGLLDEVLDRLAKRGAMEEMAPGERIQYRFSPAELICDLDEMLEEAGVHVHLETLCCQALMDGDRIDAIVMEDVSGRRVIRAKAFVDASGDGVLLRRAGFQAIQHEQIQPVSYQVLATGIRELCDLYPGVDIWENVRDLAEKYGFPESNPWIDHLPGVPGVQNIFGARLNDVDASDPDQLSSAYKKGRRCARAFIDMMRERFPKAKDSLALVSVASALGVRETWHACCLHRLTRDELLYGVDFEDSIAQGVYPVDIHGPEGTVLRYLDGRESFAQPGGELTWRRWRPEGEETAPFYQIPLRCLIPQKSINLLVAGRIMDADREAYGGVRVMVNMNQTGEAAGVAAALCANKGLAVNDVPAARVREELIKGGSLLRP